MRVSPTRRFLAAAAVSGVVLFTNAGIARADNFSASEEHPSDSLSGLNDYSLESLSPYQLDEVVWLARCIYSESDRPHEQELVAWVVRNRVETQYRGTTYREVILEDRQFSAFNAPTKRREHILSLNAGTPSRAWQRALDIAVKVYGADAEERPFAQTVRHFYSPVSMKGRSKPHWADSGEQLSSSSLGVDPNRFRFLRDVDEGFVPGQTAGETDLTEDAGSGFLLPKLKPSGRVLRPRRPSIRTLRRDG